MATVVDIVNVGLTLLGEGRIVSLLDNSKPARDANAIYEQVRDALLAGYTWSFAKKRAQLPASSVAPAFQYANAFQLPSDCLRVVMVGDYHVGVDLTDYRGSPTEEFTIEGREILTNLGAPLNFKYVARIEDSTQFSANFNAALSAKLAEKLAEPLTQSDSKRARAEAAFNSEIKLAIRSNAIELPPQRLADDDWIMSRL